MKRKFLSDEELKKLVPAAFASRPHPEVSDRYVFVPTYKIIKFFAEFGWKPVFAQQAKNRKGSENYGVHTIRFSKKEGLLAKNEYIEEIVYTGSHNRQVRVELDMGIYRCWCENQAVVLDNEFMCFNQKHIGFTFVEIEKIVKQAIRQFSKLSRKIDLYKTIELSEVEKDKFAYIIRNSHWGEDSKIDPSLLLQARRPEDEYDNLWNIYNRIQENITKGGLKYQAISEKTEKVRNRSTRQIKNIVRGLNINKEIWRVMQAFAINRNFG